MQDEVQELQMLLMDQQQTIDKLDAQLEHQQTKILDLERKVALLANRIGTQSDSDHPESHIETLEDSRPPHY